MKKKCHAFLLNIYFESYFKYISTFTQYNFLVFCYLFFITNQSYIMSPDRENNIAQVKMSLTFLLLLYQNHHPFHHARCPVKLQGSERFSGTWVWPVTPPGFRHASVSHSWNLYAQTHKYAIFGLNLLPTD